MVVDRNYRLSHCLGFKVFDPGGRIGTVTGLEYGSREDRPDSLLVRRGLLRRRRFRVPVEQVVEVDLDRRRVLVHGASAGRVRWESPAVEADGAAGVPVARLRALGDREAGR